MDKYPDFIESTGYGTGEGLCGWNCYHSFSPFIPGISVPTYTAEQLEEMNRQENTPKEYQGKQYTAYQATQRQRRLETQMRAERQKIHLLQVGGADEKDITSAKCRYRATSAEYARFSKAMDLPQQRERVTIDGLGDVRKTPAKVLGKPTSQNNLTFSQDSDKMETELGKFKALLKSDEYIDTKYYYSLKERFSHASKVSKKVFNKYIKPGSVVDSQFYGTAHYTKGSKWEKEGIYMSYQADFNNVRGVGATWFHEHGHMIDILSGGISYKNKNYIKSLRKDYENLIHIYHVKFPDMNLNEITKVISDSLTDMREYSAVSDLLHGLSGEMIEGCAIHKMPDGSSYWNDISISREAFAHMFECQSDELRYAKMKEYFPYSLKEFERMLEVI